jgi:hypothetical protein
MQLFNRRSVLKQGLQTAAWVRIGRGVCSASTPKCDKSFCVGAIRWDAWYAPGSDIGKATTKTLSPPRYQFRLPFFSQLKDHEHPLIDGNHKAIMIEEISYAVSSGLSYWAFAGYGRDNPLSAGLKLYLDIDRRDKLSFCMISELINWSHVDVQQWHIELMQSPYYQKVLSGRPLYFIGFFQEAMIDAKWGGVEGLKAHLAEFRTAITSAGLADPYIVVLDYEPETAARYANSLACDAISTYAINRNMRSAPFGELLKEAEADWKDRAATNMQVIPTVTTGFDRRPRVENPFPWGTPPLDPQSQMAFYYKSARPDQLSDELRDCLHWIDANPKSVPTRTALIYAWNENDEGGWLIPTYPRVTDRIDAVKEVLCP